MSARSSETSPRRSAALVFGIDDAETAIQLKMVRHLVAQPVPENWTDPNPGLVGDHIVVGNKKHAADVKQLLSLGVTAVLNCAPSGIRNLPLDKYAESGIRYSFTNVAMDAHNYPILHHEDGASSEHLLVGTMDVNYA